MNPTEAIKKLLAHGMTESAIGEAVGARQSTINRIKTEDMQPNWATGQKLVELALATIPAANDDTAPRKGKRKKAA